MDKFTVDLESSIYTFLPGQIVSGVVYFQLSAPESFKGLTVECIGKSKVQWTETETIGRETETVHYQASENYFFHKILLFPGSEAEFEPGEYRYPFSFTLPFQLPTSFEGVYGSLRYYVRASLNRRWMLDAVFKRAFTVNNVVDLNLNYQASIPVKSEETKTICCLCCKSGPIIGSCWLPKTGYVPGEVIFFSGRVDNFSRSRLLSTAIRLVEKTVFKAQGKQKTNERVIGEIVRSINQQQQSSSSSNTAAAAAAALEYLQIWDNVPIVVPPLAPSDLHLCSIIDLSYVLEFVINPGTLSFNFSVPLDLIIGSVPLRESFSTFQYTPSAPPATPDNTPWNQLGFAMFTDYPNLPPPIYQSSLFSGDLREEGDTEHLNIGFDTLFVPSYVTYTSRLNPSAIVDNGIPKVP